MAVQCSARVARAPGGSRRVEVVYPNPDRGDLNRGDQAQGSLTSRQRDEEEPPVAASSAARPRGGAPQVPWQPPCPMMR